MKGNLYYVDKGDLGTQYVYHAQPPRFFMKIDFDINNKVVLTADTYIDDPAGYDIDAKMKAARHWLISYLHQKKRK